MLSLVTTREKTTNGLEDKIESSDGPLMYKVKTDLGSTWRRHVDQVKPSKIAEDITQNTPLIEEPSVETTENTPLIEEPSVETTENKPLIEEPSVETTENTMTDVQTDNINDKPIDGPCTITINQSIKVLFKVGTFYNNTT